jgi:hypothetical protein
MDEEADGVVLPCGHLCGCESCLNILLNSEAKCPICRAHMNSVVKVFQSGVVEEDMQVEQKQPEVVPAQVGCFLRLDCLLQFIFFVFHIHSG